MIIHGTFYSDIRPASFPRPFIRGFGVDNFPLITGGVGFGTAPNSTVQFKVYTPNTDLTKIDFIVSSSTKLEYTAIGYWK